MNLCNGILSYWHISCHLWKCIFLLLARFQADNWNKLKNVCSKEIGEKMKVMFCTFQLLSMGVQIVKAICLSKTSVKLKQQDYLIETTFLTNSFIHSTEKDPLAPFETWDSYHCIGQKIIRLPQIVVTCMQVIGWCSYDWQLSHIIFFDRHVAHTNSTLYTPSELQMTVWLVENHEQCMYSV